VSSPQREVIESTVIPAPPDAVWDVIDDTGRYAEWVTTVIEVTDDHGRARVGETYSERNVVLGPLKAASTWTVVQADAPRRRLDRGVGMPVVRDLESIFELDPVSAPGGGQHTELRYIARYRMGLGPLGGLIDRIQQPGMRKEFRASMAKLAELVAQEHDGRT
jgi:hypothetical protein